MKCKQILFLLLILLSKVTMGQCPQGSTITAADKCIKLFWAIPPSPLPAYVVYNGITFNYSNGAGTNVSQAEYRDPSATGACSSYNQANAVIKLPNGQSCNYTGGTLPLHWISVTGNLNNQKQAVINWEVQENNVANYTIEKSDDGRLFTAINTINSKGDATNSYSFTEPTTLQGTVFYRIKQADKYGRESYSSVIKLSNNNVGTITVYPNPARDLITISGIAIGTSAVLTDVSGRVLQLFNITQASFTVNVSKYSSGVYFLKTNNNGVTQKIIKE